MTYLRWWIWASPRFYSLLTLLILAHQRASHLHRPLPSVQVMDVEAKYYADGEDAYAMKRSLEKFRRPAKNKGPMAVEAAATSGGDAAAATSS
jgi:hypothetical protein